MPGGEGERFTGPKRKKQTELARVVEDDSDAKKPRETYVSSGNGSPVAHYFQGFGGIYVDSKNQGYGDILRKIYSCIKGCVSDTLDGP
jgi:hypothetical protein